jgi:multiple sugar transport system permease protein
MRNDEHTNVMNKTKKDNISFFCYISPFIIGFTLFTVIPMIISLYFSFHKISILSYAMNKYEFFGFKNYISALKDNDYFYLAIRNTFVFSFSRIFFCVLISLSIALLLNRKMIGKKFIRTLIYIPSIIPIVGAAIIWRQLFDGNSSILSWLLSNIGIKVDSILWLGNYGLLSAIIMSVILNIGPTMIMLLAALQQVPSELLEAADIDGANAFSKFIKITVPSISPVLFYLVMTGFISSLQAYAEIELLIGTLTKRTMSMSQLVMFYYKDNTIGLGYSSALAWLVFIIITFFSLFVFKYSKKMVFFAGGDEL